MDVNAAIAKAREEGASDSQIADYLASRQPEAIQKLIDEGHSLADIFQPYGLNLKAGEGPKGLPEDPIVAKLKALTAEPITVGKIEPGAKTSEPQISGLGRIPALIGSNLASGAADLLGLPGSAVNEAAYLTNHYLVNPALRALGMEPPNAFTKPLSSYNNPVLPDFERAGKDLGLTDRADLQPQDTTEKYIAAGARGAGGTLPLAALTGGGSLVPELLRAGVVGTAGGVGSQAGAELLPEHPLIGSVVGSLIGGGAAGKGVGAAGRLAEVPKGSVTSPLVDAYDRLGIDTKLVGDIAGYKGTQSFLANTPGGGAIIGAAKKAVGQFGDAVERVANGFGQSRTLQEVGTALQDSGRSWVDGFKTRMNAAYANLDKYIAPTDRVSIANYDSALEHVLKSMPDAPETAKVLQSSLTKNLFQSLQSDADAAGTLSWQSVQGIRTKIGEMLADPNLIADTGKADLKRLYSALTGDMKTAVQGKGPDAEAAFGAATKLTKDGHAFLDNVLTPTIKEGVTPETAAKSIMTTAAKGGTTAKAIQDELPGVVNEFAGFHLRNMALAPSGSQNAASSVVSPKAFVSNLDRLSPEAEKAMYGSNPQALQDLARVADSLKSSEDLARHAHPPGHSLAIPAIAGATYAAHELGGPWAAAGAGALATTAYGAGKLAASGLLTRALAAPSGPSPVVPNYLYSVLAANSERKNALINRLLAKPGVQ